jgi:ribosome biogenesis GTPase
MDLDALVPFGWTDRWAALLADQPAGSVPARVVRHDGVALQVATPGGIVTAPLSQRLDPPPTVGDWVVLDGDHPVAVLPRTSLLSRRSALSDTEQVLAANVDLVLLVCGLDRPVKDGRIQRGAALAWDAGAVPAVVLTKAALVEDADAVAEQVADDHPGLDVLVTSAKEGQGLTELQALVEHRTVALLGESGAGKSSLVNALLAAEVAEVGRVRAGDAKGRHTTTNRHLHLLPGGGAMIDTPGIRSIGLWVDPDAVDAAFTDIEDLAEGCRFGDCAHDTEPGCAVRAAVEDGTLPAERLDAWQELRHEAESQARRASTFEQRRHERRFGRMKKETQKRKGRS